MKIGLSWNIADPEECAWADVLAPEVTKVGISPGGDLSWPAATARDLRERWGCELVVDLRTASVQTFVQEADAHGGALYDWWCEWVRAVVEETAGEVRMWEVWGEAACPYLAGAWQDPKVRDPHRDTNYADLLAATYGTIKEVDPQALVLIGGNTIDTHRRYYERVAAATQGRAYDWNCLHPFSFKRLWEDIEREYNGFFDALAATDAAYGVAHPLCMTEFGWPQHGSGGFRTREDLKSFVYDRVLSCSEEEAADWTARCFELFRARGVEFVVVLMMRDAGTGNHWGTRLGIRDAAGRPKAMWDVLREQMA